jgi:uncharacterized protein (TIGR02271 family)
MPDTMTVDRLVEMRGTPVYSSDGEKIGGVEEIFVDQETGQPEWIGLGTGFLGTKRVLVPVVGAQIAEDRVTVPYDKKQVKKTPDIDGDEISQETEAKLYAHYGLEYSESRSETGLPEGGRKPSMGPEDEASITRSEEELKVGKRDVEAGRVRLHKWVETEPVEADVELRREAVRVQRESIDQPVSGGEIGEDEIEVPVHAEEAVVQKETVAKEKIGLEKEVETETQTVTDEVRKERVEVEGDQAR